MAKKSELQEWAGHPFREEHPSDTGRDERECIANTSDDNVLEDCCIPTERRALFWLQPVPFMVELVRQLEYFVLVSATRHNPGTLTYVKKEAPSLREGGSRKSQLGRIAVE